MKMSGRGVEWILIAAASFVAGVLYSKKFYRNKYSLEKEEEIEAVKEQYRTYYSAKEKKPSEEKAPEQTKEVNPTAIFDAKSSLTEDLLKGRISQEQETGRTEETHPEGYYDYSSKEYITDFAEKEYPKEDDEVVEKIRIINPDLYIGDGTYGKATITYYLGNKAFIKEEYNEEYESAIVDDADSLFGDVLKKSGWMDNDDLAPMYIRNEELRMDYEIGKTEDAYEW